MESSGRKILSRELDNTIHSPCTGLWTCLFSLYFGCFFINKLKLFLKLVDNVNLSHGLMALPKIVDCLVLFPFRYIFSVHESRFRISIFHFKIRSHFSLLGNRASSALFFGSASSSWPPCVSQLSTGVALRRVPNFE